MIHKYSEYVYFHEISHLQDFRYFDDFRNLFGPHFHQFGRSLGTTLVIFGVTAQTLKFQ